MYISLATRCGFADDIVYNSVGAGFCLRPNTRTNGTNYRNNRVIYQNISLAPTRGRQYWFMPKFTEKLIHSKKLKISKIRIDKIFIV